MLTTGLVATTFFLTCQVEHLMLAGFMFFRTPCKTCYKIRWEADARRWGDSGGRLEPGREQRLLRTRIAVVGAERRNVSLPPNVERHLGSD